jgi:RNA polymerase sigma-70 factor (ECF subfamily)
MEAALWERLRAGDESAIGELFDACEGRVFRHARRLLTSREDAKNAVAVAFFELWRKRSSVRLVDGSPLPWLLTTVTNTAWKQERSSRRYRALLARIPRAEHAGPPVASDETGVLAALKRLPAQERCVVVLSVLEGYQDRDVAETLGIPVGTVKSRLSRAKARLRDEMTAMEASWS